MKTPIRKPVNIDLVHYRKKPPIDDMDAAIRNCLDRVPAGFLMEQCEKTIILSVLERNMDNQSETARELNISRGTLRTKLKKYGVK